MIMFTETREFLKKIGLPGGDAFDLPSSDKKFPDGADYRIEVPTINSVEAVAALLDEAGKLKITINRVDETYGIFRYTKSEIREFVKICADHGTALNFSVGPRATYDTGATVLTSQGVRIGYRLRGMEQVVYAIEDVKRAVDLGVRGILVYDEGLLWVLNEMRGQGELPSDVKFKVSAHCGHCNPASFQLMERLGADSINPVRDLPLPAMAALRQAVNLPLDLHTDNPPGSGGFIRTYEAAEIVRVASPVYLKTGNSQVSGHGQRTSGADARRMAGQAAIIKEFVTRYLPEAKQSRPNQPDMHVPVSASA